MMNDATTAAGLSPRQICFTRLGGQGSGAGWQTLNASPVVDGAAVTAFSGIQNANVKFLNHQSFDAEDMAERRVTELRCENGWAFLTRIQYGLTDALGRPCLFAHGYTFTLDELKAGPAAILDVTYGNFAFTPESTAVPLQTLSRVPRRTLRESLDAVGLDEARYRNLVIALYAVLFGGARTSLTIVCDCAEDTIRAVMECLFAALPYPLRGLLTFSTYATNPGAPTTVLFAHPSRTDRRRSFDLASGTGDAIGDAIRARFAKYRIVTYAAEHIDDEAGRDRYYAAVGEELGRLGVDGTRNLNVYNLSDSLLRERANGDGYGTPGVVHSNQQALARLVDVIGLYSQGGATAYRNELLAAVLGEMLDRGYRIPEPVAEPMCRVLSASCSSRLTALYGGYLATVVRSELAESPQAAASTMAQLLPDRTSQAFLHVRHLLAGNYRGVAVLTAYYTDIVGADVRDGVASGAMGEAEVTKYADQVRDLASQPAIGDRLEELCRMLIADSWDDCSQLTWNVVDHDMDVLEHVLAADGARQDRVQHELVDKYWRLFDFGALDWERGMDDPQLLAFMEDDRIPRATVYATVRPMYHEVLDAFSRGHADAVDAALERLRGVVDAFVGQGVLSGAECEGIKAGLLRCCEERQRVGRIYSDLELSVWVSLWRFLDKGDVIDFMQRNAGAAIAAENVDEAVWTLAEHDADGYRRLREGVERLRDGDGRLPDAARTLDDAFRRRDKELGRKKRQEEREAKRQDRQARREAKRQTRQAEREPRRAGSDTWQDTGWSEPSEAPGYRPRRVAGGAQSGVDQEMASGATAWTQSSSRGAVGRVSGGYEGTHSYGGAYAADDAYATGDAYGTGDTYGYSDTRYGRDDAYAADAYGHGGAYGTGGTYDRYGDTRYGEDASLDPPTPPAIPPANPAYPSYDSILDDDPSGGAARNDDGKRGFFGRLFGRRK